MWTTEKRVAHIPKTCPQGTLATFASGLTRCACPNFKINIQSQRHGFALRRAQEFVELFAGRIKGALFLLRCAAIKQWPFTAVDS